MKRRFTVTTPIYYVNAEPHIGHTYTTIVADTLARYHRLAGEETFFLTGTDEHGEKVAEVAAQRGLTARAFTEEISAIYRSTWEELGMSFDRFIRTTDRDHVRAVQAILQSVYDAGEIEFREYEGLYCVGCERFLTGRDMVDGLCRDHERPPEPRAESNYFFKMSRHFDWWIEQLQQQPDLIRPERYRNEVLAMLREESGLEDLCISRPKSRLGWGIELPFDADYVCYVWFDALINYLSGLGYPDDPAFQERWSGV
jgi:methionyl-tRNA synthetase